MQLKGLGKDGVQGYGFNARLDKFDPSNDFSKKLAPFVNDAHEFCTQLCTVVSGVVEFDQSGSFSLTPLTSGKSAAPYTMTKGSSTSQPAPSSSSSSKASRKRCNNVEGPKGSKQRKISKLQEDQDQLKEEIPEHHIGIYKFVSIQFTMTCILYIGVYMLPVSMLREPPQYLRVREIKEWYVEFLMKMIMDEGEDHEDITAPLLVIASVPKEEFRQKNLNMYSYEVCAHVHVCDNS